MTKKIETIKDYILSLPEERRIVIEKLREVIKNNIPNGFEEVLSYGSIGIVIPHKIYPQGYNVDPTQPLPFISISNRKNYITFSHWGLYINREILQWFKDEYAKEAKYKLSMGKSCVNLKRMDDIPFDLIGELCGKISVDDFIKMYEGVFVKKK